MPMRDTDTILGAPRGSAEEALDFARDIGAKRLDQVERYIREVYELAPHIGIDPAIVVVQSALETNNWRDEKWNRKLNAAGIGVTDNFDHGFGWDNGESSARGQIVHLWLYAKGTTLPGALARFKALDPRWDAAVDAGFAGGSPTLASLGGRWASVEDYGQRIARRSRDVFANLPNQRPPTPTPAPAPPSLPIKKNFILDDRETPRGTPLEGNDLFITVHETGNENSHAAGEAKYFVSNKEAVQRGVAVHFVVDDVEAWQTLPLDEQGNHADDRGPGDRTSIAIETCVATDLDFAKVRRNLAQLIALIASGHEVFDWGSGATRGRFSIDHVKMHNDWSGKDCPHFIRKAGFWPTLMGWVREEWDKRGPTVVPDVAWKQKRFGGKTVRRIIDGQEQEHVIAYNPDGEVSQLWERLSGEAGVWPRFHQYRQLEQREYWIFEDGFTVWRPNTTRPVRLLKATSDGEMPGVDASWKRNRFSRRQIRRTIDGQPQNVMFGYDAQDPIAQLWEQRGAETGRWPRFAGFQEGAEGREFWSFVGGFTVTRANTSEPAVPLRGDEADAIDEVWKKERFGTKTVHRILDNKRQRFVIAYDPNGAVSRLWEQRGAETGSWPPFARYAQDANRQEFWIFADGFTVWRPLARSTEPVHILAEE